MADGSTSASVRGVASRSPRRGVRELVDPEPTSMFDHVYADPHPLVDEERAWLDEWVAVGEGR